MDSVRSDLHNLARPDEVFGLVVEVGIAVVLGGDHAAVVPAADDDGGAPVAVARGDDAVFCQDKHGTGTLHFLIDILYAFHEVVLAGDHERDELGGVRRTRAQLGELLVAVEALLFQLLDIVDFGYCRDGKSTQMRVHHDGLRVGVADDADAGIALELAEVVGEFRPEIAVLNVVNGTAEQLCVLLIGDNTTALGSEMGVIVHPVEKVRNTRFGRDDPEKSAHRSVVIVLIIKKIPVRDVRL